MSLRHHRLAIRDVREILDHYENEAGTRLADRFFEALLATVAKAVENPKRFHPVGEARRRHGPGGLGKLRIRLPKIGCGDMFRNPEHACGINSS